MSAPDIRTFGCRLNAYESEAMAELSTQAGLDDTIVFNTCAVTAEAVRQARQQIRKARRERPGARIVVTGCAAQTDPDSFAAMPEVDRVIGNLEKMRPATWAGLASGESEPVQVDDILSARETAGHLISGFGTRARAYVH
ncbi:MAG: tRNA (N(6)-L-threonylcarbamoyladenosine(37)-C(2))-methylthiotransferase MtaB, partial [Pseudomonadota bacterium]